MELTQEGDPNVFGIGRNEALKNKYIKLASFLIKYSRSNDDNISVSGMTESLKGHILSLIALRKIIILRITDWLRYLIGGFYEEIHLLENLPLDEGFRQNLQIDYVSEEELLKMRLFFENELRMRDDHIKYLEDENERLKNQIKELNDNLCVMSENENALTDLQLKFKQLENEWLNQKDIIESLHNENKRLTTINSEYLGQIDGLRNELLIAKSEAERKMQSALDQMRLDYEQKISEINGAFNTINIKYSDLEKTYSQEVQRFELDKENMNNQILGYKNMYENDVNKLNSDIENLTKELVTIKNTLNVKISEISQIIGERDRFKNNEENLRNQISQLENNIKNLLSQINILNQERDDLKNQLNILMGEKDSYKNQIETLKSQISGLEKTVKNYSSNIGLLCDERDELKKQLNSITKERDGLLSSNESLNIKISQMESQISNILQNITSLTNERDEIRNMNLELNSTITRMKNESQHLTDVNNGLESRLNELQGRYDDYLRSYSKLQNDYNAKITIISNLEGNNNELNHNLQNLTEQINIYLTQIKNYEKDLENLRTQNDELRVKLLIIPEKDNEITRLKQAISSCREEWNKLSESYEQLLLDIKQQITVNESLRGVIFELQGKIETHNQQVGGLDNAIRQQIEILTRQTLAKKNIDYNPNHDKVRESTNKMDVLKTKIGRLETQKLNKSAVFSNVGFQIEENKTKSGPGISIQRSNFSSKNSNNMEGSSIYQGVKQVVMQEMPNNSVMYSRNYNSNSNINFNPLENNPSNVHMNNNNNNQGNYTIYRPSISNYGGQMQGSNIYSNNYNTSAGFKIMNNPSLMNPNSNTNLNNMNNTGGNANVKTTTTEIINIGSEDVKDKHGLFDAPVNVKEEYTYQK